MLKVMFAALNSVSSMSGIRITLKVPENIKSSSGRKKRGSLLREVTSRVMRRGPVFLLYHFFYSRDTDAAAIRLWVMNT